MKGIRIGIIANEFFDARLNRVGGFGWAARNAAEAIRGDARFDDPLFLSGERITATVDEIDGLSLMNFPSSRWDAFRTLRRARPDCFLLVDFRPSYLRWLRSAPFTPAIVWVRDPRTSETMKRLRSLTVPGASEAPGAAIDWDFRALDRYLKRSLRPRRTVAIANKMAYMRSMIPDVFGMADQGIILPNPDILPAGYRPAPKNPRPQVCFVARLDPVKRPWLFVELARRMPEVDFVMMGAAFVGSGTPWLDRDPPDNLRMLGNVGGVEKLDLIASSWVLVNTAIHDESAVSNLEALACGTPLVSYIESDELASRFGTCLGYSFGDGLDTLPRLEAAVRSLLDDPARASEIGARGREWCLGEHSTANFCEALFSICEKMGVR